ncbi:hypothetical protein EU537_07360 [Candidatus Thorarchaeota archaeon]|nr:MAG: hypothetical protein EU537_07360 [Candidatus Thorarchaeota archaeon]
MRNYETNLRTSIVAAVAFALIIVGSFLAVTFFLPDGVTTPTNATGGSFGIRAAEYLNTRRDDVEFYWMSNSTFVNENLTNYYQRNEPTAFVDAVRMTKASEHGLIEVLFTPCTANLVGTGEIPLHQWNIMSGALVDNAIAQMSDAEEYPDNFPSTWPIDFYVSIFFDDDTFFYLGYTSSDQMVYVQNGTWTGSLTEYGHPEITGYAETGFWLNSDGLLIGPLESFYNIITENVGYPSLL